MIREEIEKMMVAISESANEVEESGDFYSLHFEDYQDILINNQILPISSLILTDTTLDFYGQMGFKRYEFYEITELELE